jgi:hypothetical protein
VKVDAKGSQPSEWELAVRACRTGEVCGTCGKPFAPGDTVYVRMARARLRPGAPWGEWSYYFRRPECAECRPEKEFAPRQKDEVFRFYHARMSPTERRKYESREGACVGCGRHVVYAPCDLARWWHLHCSERCREKFYRARRAAMKPRTKICAVCGKGFTPPRNDAKTCSPACRQKSYRQRVTGKENPPRESASIRNALSHISGTEEP